MAAIVKEAIEAGALGFSTSRTLAHRAIDGEPVPGTFAAEDELFGIGRALGEVGRGVFELAPTGVGRRGHRRAHQGGRLDAPASRPRSAGPCRFALLQVDAGPRPVARADGLSLEAHDGGAGCGPQVAARPVRHAHSGFAGHHAFTKRPTFMGLAQLPLRRARGRPQDPATKAAILSEEDAAPDPTVFFDGMGCSWG